jgi:hypothetical protein
MENSTFVSDSILNTYINYAISELRDIITSKVGEDYFATSSVSTLSSPAETIALPADFYKLLWVEVLVDGQRYVKLNRFEVSEQPNDLYSLVNPATELRYRLRANNIWLSPLSATGGKTIRLWYVPTPIALTGDNDTLEGYNGWDEYVVILAARKALVKEEQDVSDLNSEIIMMNKRIEEMAPNRDQAQPMRVYDNQRFKNYDWSMP